MSHVQVLKSHNWEGNGIGSSEVCQFHNMNKKNIWEEESSRKLWEGSRTRSWRWTYCLKKIIWGWGGDVDRRSWERKKSDIALEENNQQHESQRLEFYQAKQWADQALREKQYIILWEVSTKNRIYQEHHAIDCRGVEELRRICCKQADRVRPLRTDELSFRQKQNSSTVN